MPKPNPYGWKNLRNTGKAGPAAPPAGNQPPPPAGGPPPAPKRKSRRGRLLFAGLFVGGLTAAIVLLVLWLGPSDYPEVVIVAPQSDALAYPDNAAGLEGAKAVGEWANGGVKKRAKMAGEVVTDPKARDRWREQVKPGLLAARGGVVLYFAAPVGADAAGPFVWLPPKEPTAGLTDADKLPVGQILTALKERRGPKLLVFDVTPAAANWAANGAFNDFARALKEMDAEIAGVDDLAVICSVDEDQTPWATDEWRGTVFGHHFAEAARGGAKPDPDRLVTAEGLFASVEPEVTGWAEKRRNARQTPILLPKAAGKERARKMTLGVAAPPTTAAPAPYQPDWEPLRKEWKLADDLAKSLPEQTDPAAWRQYLDWLLRWEHRVRYGLPVGPEPGNAADLRGRLRKAAAEYPLVSLGAPVASAAPDKLDFDTLWESAAEKREKGADKPADVWRQVGTPSPASRRWVAERVFDKVIATGATPDALRRADLVLAAVDAGLDERPVETHLIRMFHEHLDKEARAKPELRQAVVSALEVRRLAERAAWGGGYPEQGFRWTRNLLPDADRQRGEDLLFDARPESWEQAKRLFDAVRPQYEAAAKRAGVVSAAVAARDAVFARLPYYARWVADGRRPDADVSELVKHLGAAGEKAHELNGQLAGVSDGEPPNEAAVAKLAADAEAASKAFQAVEAAYRSEVNRLRDEGGKSTAADWHALDAAAGVPLLPAADRQKLFDRLTTVTTDLQAGGNLKPEVAPPDALGPARRHARIARAYLGDPAVAIPLEADTSHQSYRASADQIGQRLRKSPEEADKQYRATLDGKPVAERPLAEAARLTRLADPAAPVTVSPDPVAAERRYWRHEFLLGQARRCVRDGWADVGLPGPPAGWYCKKAAKLLIDEAEKSILGLIPPDPTKKAELTATLTAACGAARALAPVVVTPSAADTKLIVREDRRWTFPFQLVTAGAAKPEGYPAYWLELPQEYREPNRESLGRRTAANDARTADDTTVFRVPPRPAEGELAVVTFTLYRGHLARRSTALVYTGPPTIEVHLTNPPDDRARLALRADKGTITGAVTVLIDRSTSMWSENKVDTFRYKDAYLGLRDLVEQLPDGTHATVAWFDRVNGANRLEKFGKSGPLDKSKSDNPLKQFGIEKDDDLKPVDQAATPLAESVKQILAEKRRDEFWPKNFTGARTLIVLTDGADSEDKAKAAGKIKDALDATGGAVQLHIVFFMMTDDEAKEADKQYAPLTATGGLGKQLAVNGKLPVSLLQGVKDGKEFADRVIRSFRPIVRYKQVDGPVEGNLVATLTADERAYKPSVPLPPGRYTLTSGAKDEKWEVDLAPGEQVVLQAVRTGGKFAVTVPATAFALAAGKTGPLYPSEAARVPTGPRVYATIPAIAESNSTTGAARDLDLTFTLEQDAAGGKELRRPAPLFPWFRVTDPDPGAANTLRPMKVTCKDDQHDLHDLVAPAWKVSLLGWHGSSKELSKVRSPGVTAYWIDQGVLDAAPKTVVPAGGNRPHEDGRVESRVETDEKGRFLIVDVDYKAAGDLPYLRATGWGQTAPEERHAYYDRHHRYVVRYGPLDPAQVNQRNPLTFHLYKVADLRAKADAAGRAVTVPLPTLVQPDRTEFLRLK